MNYIGETAALGVSVFWTFSSVFFEKASHKIGSLTVNIIRLMLAVVFLGLTTLVTKGLFLPVDASAAQWFWLALSGIIGFFVGDLFLFKSYTLIGSRTASLMMSLSPMITALVGWLFLSEQLTLLNTLAVFVTVSGVIFAIAGKDMKLNVSPKGLLYAFGGAVGQALGLILSKKGMGAYDAVASTQIRAIFGLICFAALITVLKRWGKVTNSLVAGKEMVSVTLGTIFGPFIGVALALFSIQHTKTGIAATLMALVPVLIILPSSIMFKERIKVQHIIGAVICVAGVTLFFLG